MSSIKTLTAASREIRVNRQAMEKNSTIQHCGQSGCRACGPLPKELPVFTVTEPDGTMIQAKAVKVLGTCQLVYERVAGCDATGKAFIRTEGEIEIRF